MSGIKILLVDDDRATLDGYERIVRRSGYEAVALADGTALLAGLAAHRDARLLILDFQMPKMNGLLLLGRLRDRGVRCPVLLVSALTSEEVRARARRLGVVRILEKPVAPADLLDCIRGILGPAAPEAPQESTPPAAAG